MEEQVEKLEDTYKENMDKLENKIDNFEKENAETLSQ